MNTTRRHPRTLQEAFGPHVDSRLHPMPEQRPRSARIADIVFATALGVIGAALLVHWLAR
jgi:hypothetical protein